eukprot:CAMPEP_0170282108 /NCGR_PEP_ID=MMETSP0116_2-20130129/41076_1 /TAXON_ID=400756 /ORGANISM="Durinskia baltica, Strain CSIRO CS-38" /LENGTH=127 /DNA_ID=CAMNT_0010533455 /DNA_START=61 /DNA_END=442 /DNA_ORIENTATION=+
MSEGKGAVARLVSDLKMLAAFEAASDWGEGKAMDRAFSAVSWDDTKVQAALPEYLAARGADRAKVDYAFASMVSRPPREEDHRHEMIHTWLKARLWLYNKAHPFEIALQRDAAGAGGIRRIAAMVSV